MYWFPALLLFQTIKVLSFGFEMIWKSVNNDQTLTFGQTISLMSLERLALYDSTVLCTCPYCVQMCAEPLSIVMNECSAKDEARWKKIRSTHGNIYPHSHQLNMCLTLSYLYQNHSHNTEYIQDMTWHKLSEMLISPWFPSLKFLCTISGERTIWMLLCARDASWKMCACFKWIKAITCTFL